MPENLRQLRIETFVDLDLSTRSKYWGECGIDLLLSSKQGAEL